MGVLNRVLAIAFGIWVFLFTTAIAQGLLAPVLGSGGGTVALVLAIGVYVGWRAGSGVVD